MYRRLVMVGVVVVVGVLIVLICTSFENEKDKPRNTIENNCKCINAKCGENQSKACAGV